MTEHWDPDDEVFVTLELRLAYEARRAEEYEDAPLRGKAIRAAIAKLEDAETELTFVEQTQSAILGGKIRELKALIELADAVVDDYVGNGKPKTRESGEKIRAYLEARGLVQ